MELISAEIKNLESELKHVRYNQLNVQLNVSAIQQGNTAAFLPIIHYIVLDYSPLVSSFLLTKGYTLKGCTDSKFVEGVFRIMRMEFDHTRLEITPAKFLKTGNYVLHKVRFLLRLIKSIRNKHNLLLKEKRSKHKQSHKRSHKQSYKQSHKQSHNKRPTKYSQQAEYPNNIGEYPIPESTNHTSTFPLRPRSPLRIVHTPPVGGLLDLSDGLTKNGKPVRGMSRILDLDNEDDGKCLDRSVAPSPSHPDPLLSALPPPPPSAPIVSDLEHRMVSFMSRCFGELAEKIESVHLKVSTLEKRVHVLENQQKLQSGKR